MNCNAMSVNMHSDLNLSGIYLEQTPRYLSLPKPESHHGNWQLPEHRQTAAQQQAPARGTPSAAPNRSG
jgi:hypothetical protein